MLCQLLPYVSMTRLVLDGLDELTHDIQREILKSLLEVQKHAGCNCKILISSREEPQIKQSLFPKSHLRLGGKTSEGLQLYITAQAQKIRAYFPEMSSIIGDRVADRLREKAQGMFLWVRLVTAMLLDQISEAEVEHVICELPDGLDEAYGQILKRIESLNFTAKDRAFKILFWMCTIFRPVTIHEVGDGIVLTPRQRDLSKRTRTSNLQRDIVDLCAPLLERSSNGVLSLVHFSAKEYFINEKSGPFLDVAKAHLSIALSCIINLSTSLDIIPRHTHTSNDLEIEKRILKGNFGLHSYGHDFWAEHTASYLIGAGDLNIEAPELLSALEDLSHVLKHQSCSSNLTSSGLRQGTKFTAGLERLKVHPLLHDLVSGRLLFKSQLRDAKPKFDSLEAQQGWQLQTDETFLSLIDLRLGRITEKLLMMKLPEIPAEIDKFDYDYFTERFKLNCRYIDCDIHFDTSQDRNMHEATHVPSFPCLQCDFVERGFKARKDLERHIQKYHMCPEDFEIPADWCAAPEDLEADSLSRVYAPSRVSSGWSERGRKALKHGFSQVLIKLESQAASNEHIDTNTTYRGTVDRMRRKIETQYYGSLLDFRIDLQSLVNTFEEPSRHEALENIASLCDGELEKAMAGYPAFANFDHIVLGCDPHTSSLNYRPRVGQEGQSSKYRRKSASSGVSFYRERQPHWSPTEEEMFPDLLRHYGTDFVKIADCLKTKTAAEVDQHLSSRLKSGKTDWQEVADLADANLKAEVHTVDSNLDVREPGNINSEGPVLEEQVNSLDQEPQVPPQQLGSSSYILQSHDLQSFDDPRSRAEVSVSTARPASEAKRGKRKPRPKALCDLCGKELHDEYALNRHKDRRHKATRNVWTCEDISIDKNFLSRCKYCVGGKRYYSGQQAINHLRDTHFNTKTSTDVLYRWMREAEEPNPNFLTSEMEPPSRKQWTKRQKTEAKPASLRPILFDPSSSKPDLLPSLSLESDERDSGAEARLALGEVSEDSRAEPVALDAPKTTAWGQNELLADVSFDNVLPGSEGDTSSNAQDGRPHHLNQTLIKPAQVSRLSHLDRSRKIACKDQVDALYQKLDTLPEDDREYRRAFQDLVSLSRILMSDLRDWRQHSNFAPNIPFTV